MSTLPDKQQQILMAHAGLIHRVVMAIQNKDLLPQLEPVLQASAANGWTALVQTIRRILDGERDERLLAPLDEEDAVIAAAILRGLQDPATLPDVAAKPDATLAAPGLANLIHAAGTGDAGALRILGDMTEQMSALGGDMARVAAVVRPLVNGERDPEVLCRGMSAQSESLTLAIVEELGRLRTQ